jgi:UDPglucose 6-dehydrogenase
MQTIGFVGLGKLGLPCAAALSVVGKKKVIGYDINPKIREYVETAKVPYQEALIYKFLPSASISVMDDIDSVVLGSEMVFVSVQIPRDPMYEGTIPVPDSRKDFDYQYLQEVVISISEVLKKNPQKRLMIVIISIVLPGTIRRIVLPELAKFGDRVEFCYNPFFIAMGTTIAVYLNPEFILIGSENSQSAHKLAQFYSEFLTAPAKPSRCISI